MATMQQIQLDTHIEPQWRNMEQEEIMRPKSKIVNHFGSMNSKLLKQLLDYPYFILLSEIYSKSKNLWKVTGS